MLPSRWSPRWSPMPPGADAAFDVRIAALLCLLLWAAVLALTLLYTDGSFVLPRDEAYVQLQFARTLALGHPLAYNAADGPCRGCAGLLYPALLAGPWAAGVRGVALPALAQALGMLWLFLVIASLYRATRQTIGSRAAAVGVAALVLTNGPLVAAAFSGTEQGLFCAALAAAVAGWACRSDAVVLAAATVLALVRPEGALLVLVWAAATWGAAFARRAGLARREPAPAAERFRPVWLAVPVLAGLLQPALLLSLTGSPWPNGVVTRTQLFGDPSAPDALLEVLARGARALPVAIGESADGWLPAPLGWMVLALALVGLCGPHAAVRDRYGPVAERMPLVWVLLLLLVPAMLFGVDQPERVRAATVPAIPLLLLGAVAGLHAVFPQSAAASLRAWLLAVLVAASAAAGIPSLVEHGRACAELARHPLDAACWIEGQLGDAPLLVQHAGILAYHGRSRCVDAGGLCDDAIARDVVFERDSVPRPDLVTLFEHLERRADLPAYWVCYPDWFDQLVQLGLLRPRRSQTVESVRIAGTRTLALCETNWTLLGAGDDCMDPPAGWVQTDRLDVGDLADEARHGYRLLRRSPDQPVARLLLATSYEDGLAVIDGGRRVHYAERFAVAARPGLPLRLYLRTTGAQATRRTVLAGDAMAGTWDIRPSKEHWTETWFEIAGELVRGAQTEIRLNQLVHFGDAGICDAYHYWAYQPAAP